MITVVALAIPTILGFLTISVLLRNEDTCGLSARLCLAYPLGMGFLTIQMFLLALMRVPLRLGYVTAPIMVEIAVLFLFIRKRKIALTRTPSFEFFSEIVGADGPWFKKLLLLILTAIIVVKIGSIFVETYLRPIFAWDSFANWSAGAKAFYYSHSLLLNILVLP